MRKKLILLGVVVGMVVALGVALDYKLVSFTEQVQESTKGVVHISCPRWQGSGFIVGEHLILTARHVLEDVERFMITLSDGEQVYATKAISSNKHDIGFIWVDKELPKEMILELGSIKDCVLGQDLYAIGSPYGKVNFNSLTKGIVSALDRNYDILNSSMYGEHDYGWSVAFQTDTAGHPGNSGCPVFTMDGKVRGVLVGGFSPVLIIVMPVDIILNDIEQIKRMFVQDKYYFEEEPTYNQAIGYSDEWGKNLEE